jgi:hypothetical protein
MEDRDNNLVGAKEQLVGGMMELEKFNDTNVSNVINVKVKSHQDIVDVFERFAKVGKAKFDKVCKDCECLGNRIGDLERR